MKMDESRLATSGLEPDLAKQSRAKRTVRRLSPMKKLFSPIGLVIISLVVVVGTVIIFTGRATSVCTKTFAPTGNLSLLLNGLHSGDIACLQTGNYGARGTRTNWNVGNITVQAAPGGKPSIYGFQDIVADGVIVDGLLFDGPTGVVDTRNIPSGEEVLIWAHGNNITIRHSEIRNGLWHAGIYSTGTNATIDSNYIHDIGPWNDPTQVQSGGIANNIDHGIYISSGSGKIINNIIDHNLAYGIQLWDQNPNGWIIANNTLTRNGQASNGGQIILYDTITNVHVFNNILANSPGYAIKAGITGASIGVIVDHNIGFNNAMGSFNNGGNISYSANILADPKLAGANDWHLLAGSSAIDRGVSASAPTVDYAGMPRPQGAGFDIGALEFGVSSTASPTPIQAQTPTPTNAQTPTPSPSNDTTPPSFISIAPAEGSSFKRTVTLTAYASDLNGIASITVSVDGKIVATALSDYISINWNSGKTRATTGAHKVVYTATDSNGNSSAAERTFYVR